MYGEVVQEIASSIINGMGVVFFVGILCDYLRTMWFSEK